MEIVTQTFTVDPGPWWAPSSCFWITYPIRESVVETQKIVGAFKTYARANPEMMPNDIENNTKVFNAFREGWRDEKLHTVCSEKLFQPRTLRKTWERISEEMMER